MEYKGPHDAEKLWKDNTFHFSKLVRVQSSRVVRMRPIFNEWKTVVEVSYEESIINKARIDDWMQIAGTQIGFCDWRPRYGRFDVTIL
jgi:hypothetical protein